MGLFSAKYTIGDMSRTIKKWREEGSVRENMRRIANRIEAGEKFGEIPEAYNGKGRKLNLNGFYNFALEALEAEEEFEKDDDDSSKSSDELLKEIEELLGGKDRDDDFSLDDDDDDKKDDDDLDWDNF